MKASMPSSTKGSFPLLQPSPVQAVMAAMSSHSPTAADLDPENWMVDIESTLSLSGKCQ